jgi:hypothetical protein
MKSRKMWIALMASGACCVFVLAQQNSNRTPRSHSLSEVDNGIDRNAEHMIGKGRQVFRFDTFGDEEFWGGMLRLHQAIEGAKFGGVGPGLSPKAALSLGLKVDLDALPPSLIQQIKDGKIDLDNPAITLALLKLNSIVGVTGQFEQNGSLKSAGIQCALCHSAVDDSLIAGIGHRLDGWANRDLDVGSIIALAPNLTPIATLLGVDEATVRKVLHGWGPGRFDAELELDGKGFRPDGKTSAVLIPPAFGLAGVNLHTWTGWGSVPHWNAFVANLEMHGKGTFVDSRLDNAAQFPIAARNSLGHLSNTPDLVTANLGALQFYQLAIPAPSPPPGSFNQEAAERGKMVFDGRAKCAICHVPPLYTEPGWNMHTPSEVCVDDFQANRSPDKHYRTAPLGGLWTHTKGGFYHDARFPALQDVVAHYDKCMSLGLTEREKTDLAEFLMSLPAKRDVN